MNYTIMEDNLGENIIQPTLFAINRKTYPTEAEREEQLLMKLELALSYKALRNERDRTKMAQIFAPHPIFVFECGETVAEKNTKEDIGLKLDISDYLRKYWIAPTKEYNQDVPSKFLLKSLLNFYTWAIDEILEKISLVLGKSKK